MMLQQNSRVLGKWVRSKLYYRYLHKPHYQLITLQKTMDKFGKDMFPYPSVPKARKSPHTNMIFRYALFLCLFIYVFSTPRTHRGDSKTSYFPSLSGIPHLCRIATTPQPRIPRNKKHNQNPRSLTACPWKVMMIGRLLLPIGMAYFAGASC